MTDSYIFVQVGEPCPRFFVYGLHDPTSLRLFYVGSSARGIARPREHFHKPSLLDETRVGANSHKIRAIKKLLAQGTQPLISILEQVPSHHALAETEIRIIAECRKSGAALTNITSGGEGTLGRKHTEASKQKMRDRALARFKDPHQRELNAEMWRVVHSDPEVKQKAAYTRSNSDWLAAAKRRGKAQWTPEHRAMLAERGILKQVVDQHGAVYPSIVEAARVLELDAPAISHVLAGRKKSTKGYVFKYFNP